MTYCASHDGDCCDCGESHAVRGTCPEMQADLETEYDIASGSSTDLLTVSGEWEMNGASAHSRPLLWDQIVSFVVRGRSWWVARMAEDQKVAGIQNAQKEAPTQNNDRFCTMLVSDVDMF